MRVLDVSPKAGDRRLYQGVQVDVLDVFELDTPSGSSVGMAKIRRPRAGEKIVFVSDLFELPFRFDEPDPATFRP